MYMVRVEGTLAGKSYVYCRPTNLELALDHMDDMVYSAESIGVENIQLFWLDEHNDKGWQEVTIEYMGRK